MKRVDDIPPSPLSTKGGDAAPASGRPFGRRQYQHGGTILGLFVGLVLGVMIAFGVVWYLKKSPIPFLDKSSHAEKPDAKAAGEASAPMTLPGKPGDKAVEKPRFEFYKILPGGEAVQSAAAPTPAQAPPQPVAAATPSESFYLQAGAFQKAQDADNLKAKLAMLGLDPEVQEANLADKGVMYRVRVGPYSRPDDMNKARTQLSQNGIQATVIKAGSH